MKKQRLGTHVPSLSDATGGLVDDLGSPLINTNTEGGSAQTLGATLRRELVAGVANGDFSIPPARPTAALPNEDDDNDNGLPFWTLVSPGGGVVAKLVQTSSAASGYELRFTIKPGALNGTAGEDGHTHYLERYLPVAASRARSFIYQPRTTWSCSSGASSANVSIWAEAQYFTREEVAIGTAATGSLAMTGLSQEVGLQPSAVAVEADAGFLRYRTGITVTGAISTTETATIREIRMSSGEVQAIFADQSAPGSNRGSISLNNARLTSLVAGGAGASAYLDATGTSSPNSRGTFSFDTVAPIGTQYWFPVTTVVSGDQTTLSLAGGLVGAGVGLASGDLITPPAGLYLVTLNASFEISAGGSFRQISLWRDSFPWVFASAAPAGSSISTDLCVSGVVDLDGEQTISATAFHDAGADLDITLTQLTLVRLGAAW